MFTIYANGKVLADSHVRGPYMVEDPTVTVEKGKAPSFQFMIYASHPLYDQMEKLTTYVDVYLDYGSEDKRECIFSGRILHTESSEDGKMSVYCEGCYSYLIDTLYSSEEIEETPEEHFIKLIDSHNSQVDDRRQFIVGEMNFGSSEKRTFGESQLRTPQEAIESDFIDYYGGYVRIRKLGRDLYIDYLQDEKKKSSQKISFKRNLLAYQDSISGEDLFTSIYPLGASLEVEVTEEETEEPKPEPSEPGGDGEDSGDEEEEIPLPEPWKPKKRKNVTIGEANGGIDILENQELVEKYGRIIRSVSFEEGDTPESLLKMAQEYMDRYSFGLLRTITLTAIDLKNFDVDAESIKVGEYVGVILPFGDKEIELPCVQIQYNLANPEENQYTLGEKPQEMSGKYKELSGSVDNNTNNIHNNTQMIGELGQDMNINAHNIKVNAQNIDIQAKKIDLNAKNIAINADKIKANAKRIDLAFKELEGKIGGTVVQQYITELQQNIDNSNSHWEQTTQQLWTSWGELNVDINGDQGHLGLTGIVANLQGAWEPFKHDWDEIVAAVDQIGEWAGFAEFVMDAANATIDLEAAWAEVTELGQSLSDVKIALDGKASTIDLQAMKTTVNDISTRMTNAEIRINGAEANILLKADKTEVDKVNGIATDAKAWIDLHSDSITNTVTVTTNLNSAINGSTEGGIKHPGIRDEIFGYTYMDEAGTPVVVPGMKKDVSTATSEIKQLSDSIKLKVDKDGIINEINLSTEGVKINAVKVDLGNYATVGYLNANFVKTDTLDAKYVTTNALDARFSALDVAYASKFTTTTFNANSANVNTLSAQSGIQASSVTVNGVELGKHYHSFSESGGKITIGGPTLVAGSFNIADTKTYKDGVSAAASTVDVDKITMEWKPASITYFVTATLTNKKEGSRNIDASKAYNAGEAEGFGNGWNAAINSITYGDFTSKYNTSSKTYSVEVPVNINGVPAVTLSDDIDASQAYNAGASNVTIDMWAPGIFDGDNKRFPVEVTLTNYHSETRYVNAAPAYNAGVNSVGFKSYEYQYHGPDVSGITITLTNNKSATYQW